MEKRTELIIKFAILTIFAWFSGIKFIVAWFHRTADEQNKLYKEGKSKLDGYVKISAHQRWRAIDIYIVKDNDIVLERTPEYEKLGSAWKLLGGLWGGDFESLNDIFHYEV